MIQSIIIIGQHLKKSGNICIFKFNCLFQFTFSLKYGICEFFKIFFIWPTCEHVCVKIFTRIHWIEYKTICWLLFFFNQSVSCRSVALGRFEKFGWTTTKIQFRMCQTVEIYGALKIALGFGFPLLQLPVLKLIFYLSIHGEFRSHAMQESKEKLVCKHYIEL